MTLEKGLASFARIYASLNGKEPSSDVQPTEVTTGQRVSIPVGTPGNHVGFQMRLNFKKLPPVSEIPRSQPRKKTWRDRPAWAGGLPDSDL